MRLLSILPPKYPAAAPSIVPMTSAMAVAPMPTASETRPPYSVRAKISRPASSVPNQCSADGPALRSLAESAFGSCVMSGARMAEHDQRNHHEPSGGETMAHESLDIEMPHRLVLTARVVCREHINVSDSKDIKIIECIFLLNGTSPLVESNDIFLKFISRYDKWLWF